MVLINYMKINVRIILIGVMASILSINTFACDSSLNEKPGLEESVNFVQQKPPTPMPTLNKVVESVATPVEQLSIELQQSSIEICPCDIKFAITSSKPMDVDDKPEEMHTDLSPTPTTKPLVESPPFYGTLFVSSEILVSTDPTAFYELEKIKDSPRTMYDRRKGWITLTPHLFKARFLDGLTIEVQVNPEFKNAVTAEEVALKYLKVIGQLPTLLRKDIETIWIHEGDELFGGGNNNLLIHHGQGLIYETQGLLEEVFLHEAVHTSLDNDHLSTPGWLKAQQDDGQFISDYAKEFPSSEDISESFPMYFALRYKASRIETHILKLIENTIPNRIEYFDKSIPDLTEMLDSFETPTSESTNTPTPIAKELVVGINIKNYEFPDISIDVGEVVQWKNLDLYTHSATSGIWGGEDDTGDLWDSGKLTFGNVFEFKFTVEGEYPYFCRIHPGMKGVVRVLDSSK